VGAYNSLSVLPEIDQVEVHWARFALAYNALAFPYVSRCVLVTPGTPLIHQPMRASTRCPSRLCDEPTSLGQGAGAGAGGVAGRKAYRERSLA